MGTELLRMGWSPKEHGPSPSWNITHPDLVRAVHAQWAAFGAQIHRTNTFTLLPTLAFGSQDEQFEAWKLVVRGIELVREAARGGKVLVALGPVDPNSSPPQGRAPSRLQEILSQADGILLETWSHPHVADWANWIRPKPEIPLILSGCFRQRTNQKETIGHPNQDCGFEGKGKSNQISFETLGGYSPKQWVAWAERSGADAVGFNCGWEWSPESVNALVEELGLLWPGPIWCFPGPILPKGQKCSNWERSMWGGCCGASMGQMANLRSLCNLECSTKRL